MVEQCCVQRIGTTDLLDGCHEGREASTIVSRRRMVHERIAICRFRFTLGCGDKHVARIGRHAESEGDVASRTRS